MSETVGWGLGSARTSVKATANPSLLLSLGLASPRISLRIEYDTSCAFSTSSPSDFAVSLPSSSSSDVSGESFGTKFAWKCSRADMSFTDASIRSFLFADERCQKRGRVVDMAVAATGLALPDWLGALKNYGSAREAIGRLDRRLAGESYLIFY